MAEETQIIPEGSGKTGNVFEEGLNVNSTPNDANLDLTSSSVVDNLPYDNTPLHTPGWKNISDVVAEQGEFFAGPPGMNIDPSIWADVGRMDKMLAEHGLGNNNNFYNPLPGQSAGSFNPFAESSGILDPNTLEGRRAKLTQVINNAQQKTPGRNPAYRDPIYYGAKAFNLDRYTSHPAFDRLGFHPFADNDAYYNANSSKWENFQRTWGAFGSMFHEAFTSPWRSIGDFLEGDWNRADYIGASAMEDAMRIGRSTKGGVGGFFNDLFLNFSYTLGIISNVVLEEMALAGITYLSGGTAAPAAGARTVYNVGRIMRTGDKINDARKASQRTLEAMKNYNNVNNFWKFTRGVGRWTMPQTAQFYRRLRTAGSTVDNMNNLGKLRLGAGALYRDLRMANLAWSEAKMEAGLVEMQLRNKKYQEYRRANNGAHPDEEWLNALNIDALNSAQTTIFWNAPFIHLTNQFVFPGLGRGFRGIGRQFDDSLDAVPDAIQRELKKQKPSGMPGKFYDAGKGVSRIKSEGLKGGLTKGANYALRYFGANVGEGAQELYQEAVAVGVEHYYGSLFDMRLSTGLDLQRADMELSAQQGSKLFWDSFQEGANSQMGWNGFKVFMSGFMMGGLARMVQVPVLDWAPNYVNKKWNQAKYDKYEKKKEKFKANALEYLENGRKDPLHVFDKTKINVLNQREANQQMYAASFSGQAMEHYDAKDWAKFEHFETYVSMGKTHHFIDIIDDYLALDNKSFREAFPVETYPDSVAKIRSRLEQNKKEINEMKRKYEERKELYSNPFSEDRFEEGTVLYQQEKLRRLSYDHARKLAMYVDSSFERAVERINNMYKALSSGDLKVLKNIQANELDPLMGKRQLEAELELLNVELTGTLSQKDIKFKTKKKELLTEFSNIIHNPKYQTPKTKVFSKTHMPKLRKAFTDYLNFLAKAKNEFVESKNIDKALSAIVDTQWLEKRSGDLHDAARILMNPKKLEQVADRINFSMRRVWNTMRDKNHQIKEIDKYIRETERMAVLQKLSEEDIYPHPIQTMIYLEQGIKPTLFYNKKGIIDQLNQPEEHKKILSIFNLSDDTSEDGKDAKKENAEEIEKQAKESKEKDEVKKEETDLTVGGTGEVPEEKKKEVEEEEEYEVPKDADTDSAIVDLTPKKDKPPAALGRVLSSVNNDTKIQNVLNNKYEQWAADQALEDPNRSIMTQELWEQDETLGGAIKSARKELFKLYAKKVSLKDRQSTPFDTWLKSNAANLEVDDIIEKYPLATSSVQDIMIGDVTAVQPMPEEKLNPSLESIVSDGKKDKTGIWILKSSIELDPDADPKELYTVTDNNKIDLSEKFFHLDPASLDPDGYDTLDEAQRAKDKILKWLGKPEDRDFVFDGIQFRRGMSIVKGEDLNDWKNAEQEDKGNYEWTVMANKKTVENNNNVWIQKKVGNTIEKGDKPIVLEEGDWAADGWVIEFDAKELSQKEKQKTKTKLQKTEPLQFFAITESKGETTYTKIKRHEKLLKSMTPEKQKNLVLRIMRMEDFEEKMKIPVKKLTPLEFETKQPNKRIRKGYVKHRVFLEYDGYDIAELQGIHSSVILDENNKELNPMTMSNKQILETFVMGEHDKARGVTEQEFADTVRNNYKQGYLIMKKIDEYMGENLATEIPFYIEGKKNPVLEDIGITIQAGNIAYSTSVANRSTFDQLEYKSVDSKINKDGSKGSQVIYSLYKDKNGDWREAPFDNFDQATTENEDYRDSQLELIENDRKMVDLDIKSLGRYVMVIRDDRGVYTYAALQPREKTSVELEEMFTQLKERHIKTLKENYVSVEGTNKRMIKKGKKYTDQGFGMQYNNEFNSNFAETHFIASKTKGDVIVLGVDPYGNINLEYFNRITKHETRVSLNEEEVATASNFLELLNLLNEKWKKTEWAKAYKKVEGTKKAVKDVNRPNFKIQPIDFRISLPRTITTEQLSDVKILIQPEIRKNIRTVLSYTKQSEIDMLTANASSIQYRHSFLKTSSEKKIESDEREAINEPEANKIGTTDSVTTMFTNYLKNGKASNELLDSLSDALVAAQQDMSVYTAQALDVVKKAGLKHRDVKKAIDFVYSFKFDSDFVNPITQKVIGTKQDLMEYVHTIALGEKKVTEYTQEELDNMDSVFESIDNLHDVVQAVNKPILQRANQLLKDDNYKVELQAMVDNKLYKSMPGGTSTQKAKQKGPAVSIVNKEKQFNLKAYQKAQEELEQLNNALEDAAFDEAVVRQEYINLKTNKAKNDFIQTLEDTGDFRILENKNKWNRRNVLLELMNQYEADIKGIDPNLAGKFLPEVLKSIDEHDIARRQEFIEFMRENLPQFMVDRIDNLEWNSEKMGALMGAFVIDLKSVGQGLTLDNLVGKVYLSKTSKFDYHEAGHATMRMLMTDEEIATWMATARKNVRAQMRSKEGYKIGENADGSSIIVKNVKQALEHLRLQSYMYSQMSDNLLEKRLYEEDIWDNFQLYKENPKNKKVRKEYKGFFSWLVEMIKKVFKFFTTSYWNSTRSSGLGGPYDSLFEKIDNGKYRTRAIQKNQFTEGFLEGGLSFKYALKPIPTGRPKVLATSKLIEGQEQEVLKQVTEYFPPEEEARYVANIVKIYLELLDKMEGKYIPNKVLLDAVNIVAESLNPKRQIFQDMDPGDYRKIKSQLKKDYAALSSPEAKRALMKSARVALTRHDQFQDAFDEMIMDKDHELEGRTNETSWDEQLQEIGPEKTASRFVRDLIATTVLTDQAGQPLGDKKYGFKWLDDAKTIPAVQPVDYMKAFNALLLAGEGIENHYERFRTIWNQTHYKPDLKAVMVNILNLLGVKPAQLRGNSWMQNVEKNGTAKQQWYLGRIIKAFDTVRVDYYNLIQSDSGNTKGYVNIINAAHKDDASNQLRSATNVYLGLDSKWQGEGKESRKLHRRATGVLNDWNNILSEGKPMTDEKLARKSKEISTRLRERLGIELHPATIENSIINFIELSTEYQKQLFKQQNKLQDSKQFKWQKDDVFFSLETISTLRDANVPHQYLSLLAHSQYLEFDEMSDKEFKSVMNERESGALGRWRRIFRINALYDPNVGHTVFRDMKGNWIYAHQIPTYTIRAMQKWNDLNHLDNLKAKNWFNKNHSYFLQSPDFRAMSKKGMHRTTRLLGGKMTSMKVKDNKLIEMRMKDEAPAKGVSTGEMSPAQIYSSLANMMLKFYNAENQEVTTVVDEDRNGYEFALMTSLLRTRSTSNTFDFGDFPVLDAVIKNKSGQSIINPEFVEMVIRWMIQPQYERIRLENARFNNVNEGIPLTKEIIINYNDFADPTSDLTSIHLQTDLLDIVNIASGIKKIKLPKFVTEAETKDILSGKQTAFLRTAEGQGKIGLFGEGKRAVVESEEGTFVLTYHGFKNSDAFDDINEIKEMFGARILDKKTLTHTEAIKVGNEFWWTDMKVIKNFFSQNQAKKESYKRHLYTIKPLDAYTGMSGSLAEELLQRQALEVNKWFGSHKDENFAEKVAEEDVVVVFGANSLGLHGRGGAGFAMGKQRSLKQIEEVEDGTVGDYAIKGKTGLMQGSKGLGYGLITVSGKPKGRYGGASMTTIEIVNEIKNLYSVAENNPETTFKVLYELEENEKSLNGYTGQELADMFVSAGAIPENIQFNETFADLLYVSKDTGSRSRLMADVNTKLTEDAQTLAQDGVTFKKFREEFQGPNGESLVEIVTNRLQADFDAWHISLRDTGALDLINPMLKKDGLTSNSGKKNKKTKLANKSLGLIPGNATHNLMQIFLNDYFNTKAAMALLFGDEAKVLGGSQDKTKRGPALNYGGDNVSSQVASPENGIPTPVNKFKIWVYDDTVAQDMFMGTEIKTNDAYVLATTFGRRAIAWGLGIGQLAMYPMIDEIESNQEGGMPATRYLGNKETGEEGYKKFGANLASLKLAYMDGSSMLKMTVGSATPEMISHYDGTPMESSIPLWNMMEKMRQWESKNPGQFVLAVPRSAAKMLKVNPASINDAFGEPNQFPISEQSLTEATAENLYLQVVNPTNKMEGPDPRQKKTGITQEQDFVNIHGEDIEIPGWEVIKDGKKQPITIKEVKEFYKDNTKARVTLQFTGRRNLMFDLGTGRDKNIIETDIDPINITVNWRAFLEYARTSLMSGKTPEQFLEFFETTIRGQNAYELNNPLTLPKFDELFRSFFAKGVLGERVPGHGLTLIGNGRKVVKQVVALDKNDQPVHGKSRVIRDKHWKLLYKKGEKIAVAGMNYARENKVIDGKSVFVGEFDGLKVGDYYIDVLRTDVPQYIKHNSNGEFISDHNKWELSGEVRTEIMVPFHNPHAETIPIDQEIPESLSTMYMTRIPTDDKKSQDVGKVVNELPVYMGSVVMASNEHIFRSGADMDNDKDYTQIFDTYVDDKGVIQIYGDQFHSKKRKSIDKKYEEYIRKVVSEAKKKNSNMSYAVKVFKERLSQFKQESGVILKTSEKLEQEFVEWLSNLDKDRKVKGKSLFAQKLYNAMKRLDGDNLDMLSAKLRFASMRGYEYDIVTGKFIDLFEEDIHIDSDSRYSVIQKFYNNNKILQGAMTLLGLPLTIEQFIKFELNHGSPNLGALNNNILQASIALLQHEGMRKSQENGLPGIKNEPTTTSPYDTAWKYYEDNLPGLFKRRDTSNINVDNMDGKSKAFITNKIAEKNVGAVVTPKQILDLLGEHNVELFVEDWQGKPLPYISFEGHTFNKLNTQYTIKNGKEDKIDGVRTGTNLAAMINAMTDNGTHMHAGKFNITANQAALQTLQAKLGMDMTTILTLSDNPILEKYIIMGAFKQPGEPGTRKLVEGHMSNLVKKYGQDMLEIVAVTVLDQEIINSHINSHPDNNPAEYGFEIIDPSKNYGELFKKDPELALTRAAEEYLILQLWLNTNRVSDSVSRTQKPLRLLKGPGRNSEETSFIMENIKEMGLDLDTSKKGNDKFNKLIDPIDNMALPFDARKAFRDSIMKTYLDIFFQMERSLAPALLITETPFFKKATDIILTQLKNKAKTNERKHKIKKDILSYLTARAVRQHYLNNGMIKEAQDMTNGTLYETLKISETQLTASEALAKLSEYYNGQEEYNFFAQGFLSSIGERSPMNASGMSKVTSNTWTKLEDKTVRHIRSAFMKAYDNPVTHDWIMTLLHYELVKNGLQYTADTFITAIPPQALEEVISTITPVHNFFKQLQLSDTRAENLLGMTVPQLLQDMTLGYLGAEKNNSILKELYGKPVTDLGSPDMVDVYDDQITEEMADANPNILFVYEDVLRGGKPLNARIRSKENVMGLRMRKHYKKDEKSPFLDANEQTLMKDNFDKDLAAIRELMNETKEDGSPLYESIVFPSFYLMGDVYLEKQEVQEETEETEEKDKKKKEKAPYKGKSEKVYKHMREQIKKQFGFNIQSGRVAASESIKAKRAKQLKEAAIAKYPNEGLLVLSMKSGLIPAQDIRSLKRKAKGKGNKKEEKKFKAMLGEAVKKNKEQWKTNLTTLREGGVRIIEIEDPNDANATILVMEAPLYYRELEYTYTKDASTGKKVRNLSGITTYRLLQFNDPTRQEEEIENFFEFDARLEKKGITTPNIVYATEAIYEAVKTTFSNLQNPMVGNALLLPTQEPIYYETIRERQEEIKERYDSLFNKKKGFMGIDISAQVANLLASRMAAITGGKKPDINKVLTSSLPKSAFKNTVKDVQYTQEIKATNESVEVGGKEITNQTPAEKLLMMMAKGAIKQQEIKKQLPSSTKKSVTKKIDQSTPETSKYEGRLRGIWKSLSQDKKEAIANAFGEGDIAMTEVSEQEFVNYYFRYKKYNPTFTLKEFIKKINECY